MFDTIFGIPVHPLAVHATVVLVPAAALLIAVVAPWPAARARLGWITPAAAAVAFVLIPVSTESGERLQARVPRTDLVRTHAQMADGLLPFVGIMLVAVAVLVYLTRRAVAAPRAVTMALMVVCVAASLGTIVQVIRIGHSGAVAVWQQVGQQPAPPHER